jgi:hypothetical protein
MTHTPRPWKLLHLVLTLLVIALVAVAGREMSAARTLPPVPLDGAAVARPVPTLVATRPPADLTPASSYAVIATRNLFTASRSEATAVAPAAEAGPRPVLHGVVTDGEKSRAYIEDTPGGRVFSYAAGDSVGGGRLERIADDRVTIRRPEGAMEIMLRDSSKPASMPGAAASPGAAPSVGSGPAHRPR